MIKTETSKWGSTLLILSLFLFSSASRLYSRQVYLAEIKNPVAEFNDWRQAWLGKQIRFLPGVLSNNDDPYFEFCYDPYRWSETHPRAQDIVGKTAHFVRVFHFAPAPGMVEFIGQFNTKYLWQLTIDDTGENLYFRDSGTGVPQPFAFIEIFIHTSQLIGLEFWAKDEHVLFSPGNDTIVPLKNLEKVTVVNVEMGDYGNFPTRIFLRTENGQIGYLTTPTVQVFAKRWYQEDPKYRFPDWEPEIWQALQNRTVRKGMVPEMVIMSWGEPDKIETKTVAGMEIVQWIYEGVKQTNYTLQFIAGQLAIIDY